MCGISGILSLSGTKVSRYNLKKITDSIAHRGPDGEGFWFNDEETVGLGHRRLSILDVSESGKQPMSYANERLHITYNGEIFNFYELRLELIGFGYNFQSDTDTEIILAAYHRWGPDCLSRFNGMWAFAIWDEDKQELFLARDRFGIKPLYYLFDNGRQFVFGSETLQFKYLDNFNRRFDENNLIYSLRSTLNVLEGEGKTIFDGINQVLPGHYAVLKNKSFKQTKWWNTLDNIPIIAENYDAQVKQLREILIDSCRLRIRSDVNIASALSGGVDSSSIFCVLHKYLKGDSNIYRTPQDWQKAFVASFPGTSQDETDYAKVVVDSIGAQGIFVTPKSNDLIENLISSTIKFDSIYMTPISVIADVYKEMRNYGITVSLDGHGVDEMMYGYTGTLKPAYKWAIDTANQLYSTDIAATYSEMFKRNTVNVSIDTMNSRANNKAKILLKSANRNIKAIFHPDLRKWTKKYVLDQSSKPRNYNHLIQPEWNLYEFFHYSALPTLLRNFDKASMMSGIEIRMPFMDYRLVSYVFGLPISSKLGNGFTKRILRDSMDGILPDQIKNRKLKIGIAAPMAEWFNDSMAEFINDEVSSQTFLQTPYWNGKAVKAFVNKRRIHKDWNDSSSVRFWLLLNAHILINRGR